MGDSMTSYELHACLELAELDSDLREEFEKIGLHSFVVGLPTKIQLNRLLRKILVEIKQGNQCGQHGSGSNDDI